MGRMFRKFFERRHRKRTRRELGWAIVILLGASLFTLVIERLGLLAQLQTISLDLILRNEDKAQSHYSHDVAIVGISDADYNSSNFFGGTSPLKVGLVKALIEKVAALNPAVIGVDLDLSDSDLPKQIGSKIKNSAVVWAEITEEPRAGERPRLKPQKAGWPEDSSGVALFPLDWDRVVRHYTRAVQVVDNNDLHTVPSFVWSVYQRYALPSQPYEALAEDRELRLLNFAGDRYSFEPIDMAALWDGPQPALTGKIVLIGGMFSAARDRYMTPLGEKYGVSIIAQAIESERLHGGGIPDLNEWWPTALELAIGAVLVWFYGRLRPLYPLLTAVVIGAGVPLLVSKVAFGALAYWPTFVPVAVGVVGHELYDELREGRQEVQELREKVKELRSEVSAARREAAAAASEAPAGSRPE